MPLSPLDPVMTNAHCVPDTKSLDVDQSTVLELLTDSRRRAVITALSDREEPVDLQTLARMLRPDDRPADAAPTAESIRIALYHVHVPKLVEAGVLDREDTGVVLTDGGEALATELS